MSRKIKLVVSDFHIGSGKFLKNGTLNPLEDFFFDGKFIEFLKFYSEREFASSDIELICNGDFFNHLHLNPYEDSPDVLSEKVAVRRMDEILKGHPELFATMKSFSLTKDHRITFTLGNHDPGLLFPSVVKQLQEAFGERTTVRLDTYRFDGVHIEHGNQYFADNAYDQKKFFLTKNLPAPIINLPWGSYFVIHLLDRVRLDRPYFSKIYPFGHYIRWALIHDTKFAIKTIAKMLYYFVSLRFGKDPRRSSSFIRTLKIIKEFGLAPRLPSEAKKILLTQREVRIVIFGHTHHATLRQFAPDKTYINTGLWNEQISLELSDPGRLVKLTYAFLDYDDQGKPQASLKIWRGKRHITEDLYE
jgi:UDP-2,3-diacylglucosamine pyrophosphatase LpxH